MGGEMSSEGSGVRDNEDDHLCVRGIYIGFL